MKLTKHQKEIVKKIVAEEVYDIPSYLKVFGKGHIVKYEIADLKRKFDKDEQGKTYKVMKKGHSIYQQIPQTRSIGGITIKMDLPLPRTKESISDDEWEYQPAVLDKNIPPQKINHGDKTFEFDFQNSGVFIADNFEDIKGFISLWSYLRREALVLEVDKTIEANDISVYYQLEPVASDSNVGAFECNQLDCDNIASDGLNIESCISIFKDDILNKAPVKQISSYLESTWWLNEEHKLMCKEFIGKKILPNSDLIIYLANKYKTTNEITQHHSLIVAWIAVGLSLIAILLGNILPLFQPSNSDYFNEINKNLDEISENLTNLSRTKDGIVVTIKFKKTETSTLRNIIQSK